MLQGGLRVTRHGRTCAQRWDARLQALLHDPAARSRLHGLRRAIAFAPVVVHGDLAWIQVRSALLDGPNRFRWTENCWMLES